MHKEVLAIGRGILMISCRLSRHRLTVYHALPLCIRQLQVLGSVCCVQLGGKPWTGWCAIIVVWACILMDQCAGSVLQICMLRTLEHRNACSVQQANTLPMASVVLIVLLGHMQLHQNACHAQLHSIGQEQEPRSVSIALLVGTR